MGLTCQIRRLGPAYSTLIMHVPGRVCWTPLTLAFDVLDDYAIRFGVTNMLPCSRISDRAQAGDRFLFYTMAVGSDGSGISEEFAEKELRRGIVSNPRLARTDPGLPGIWWQKVVPFRFLLTAKAQAGAVAYESENGIFTRPTER